MKTLFNTYDERHAFIIGFSESFCPWPPRYYLWNDEKSHLEHEYHYYSAGRAVGAFCLYFCLGAALIFFGV